MASGTIEIGALREQLRALGHDLPEGEVVSILKEMRIDWHDLQDHSMSVPPPSQQLPADALGLGQEEPMSYGYSPAEISHASEHSAFPMQPWLRGVPASVEELQADDAVPAHLTAEPQQQATLDAWVTGQQSLKALHPTSTVDGHTRLRNDCYFMDPSLAPPAVLKQPYEWYGKPTPGPNPTATQKSLLHDLTKGDPARSASDSAVVGSSLARLEQHSSLWDTGAGAWERDSGSRGAADRVQGRQDSGVLNSAAAPAKESALLDLHHGREFNDFCGAGPENQRNQAASRRLCRPARRVDDDLRLERDVSAAQQGAAAERSTALLRAAEAAAVKKPAKYQWADHLRSSSPTASSVISLPHSTTSTASTWAGTARKDAVPKKLDRVKRYQEMQQSWSKDSFLKHAQSKPGSAPRQPSAVARKPVNFHSHFAMLHSVEAEERAFRLKESRSKTAAELREGVEYVAPSSKRRDALRWETRLRMQG